MLVESRTKKFFAEGLHQCEILRHKWLGRLELRKQDEPTWEPGAEQIWSSRRTESEEKFFGDTFKAEVRG